MRLMLLVHKGCYNSQIVLRMVTVAREGNSYRYASMWVCLLRLGIYCGRGRPDRARSDIIGSSLSKVKA